MARIRTIKPEFWQNEQLARLTEHARLLAIALLNHADDVGYFKANAYLVRAACFPFDEDSTKVLGSLQELSTIGFIELRSDGEKQVGRVCKFREHQRIDKPGASKLEDAFDAMAPQNTENQDDSTNVLGGLSEDSRNTQRLEQGTGNRETEQGSGTGNRETEQGSGTGTANAASVCVPKQPKSKRSTSERPTVEQVASYCDAKGYSVDAVAFVAYYESNGWKQSNGNTIKDWQAAVVTWEKRNQSDHAVKSVPKTFSKMRQENTQRAFDEVFDGR